MKRFFTKQNGSNIISISLLAILLCLLFGERITDEVYKHAKMAKIYINVNMEEENDVNKVKILDNHYKHDKSSNNIFNQKWMLNFESLKANIISNDGFSTFNSTDNESDKYFQTESKDSMIVFELPILPNTSLSFAANENANSQIRVYKEESENLIREFHTSEIISSQYGYYRYYLFDSLQDTLYLIIYYIIYYVLLFIVFYISLLLFHYILFYYSPKIPKIISVNGKVMFLVLTISLYLYLSLNYAFNYASYQIGDGADAYFYMHPIFHDANGNVSLETFVQNSYSFRGYIPSLISAIFNSIAYRVGNIDVMYIHFAFISIVCAFTVSIAMPMIYEFFTYKKTKNIMIIVSFIIFVRYWQGLLFYVLSDVPAAMFAICALAYMLYGVRKGKNIYYILSGLFIGASVGYRSSYSIITYALTIFIIGYHIIKRRKLKTILATAILIWCGIVIILLPQAKINALRGENGLFPYNSGWEYDTNIQKEQSLTEMSFQMGLHSYYFLTEPMQDKQTLAIDQTLFTDKVYTINDTIYILLNRPIDFFTGYLKKIFFAMSFDASGLYIQPATSSTMHQFCIMFNYLMIGTLIYTFFKKDKKLIPKGVGWLYLVSFALTTLLQGLLHLEYRYFVVMYLMIYMYNGFFVLGAIIENREKARGYFNYQYVIAMFFFIIVGYMARITLSYNFL